MGLVKNHYHDVLTEISAREQAEYEERKYMEEFYPSFEQPKPPTDDAINIRMFGNFEEMQDETKEFLRLEDRGDLYLIVATPYDEKYEKNKQWYQSNIAFRAVARMVQRDRSRPDYVMTRESLDCAKAHINCLVYSKQDLVKQLHGKNKYKYHYHVQKVERPVAARDYIFKDSIIYTFLNGDDYVIQYRVNP